MSRRARLALIASLAIVLAGAIEIAAQMVVCPTEARYAFRPRDDGGRIEYCETTATAWHGPYLVTDGEAGKLLQGQFVDGKPVGRWNGWYTDGRVAGEADFAAGEIRRVVAWDAAGVLVFQADTTDVTLFDRGKFAQDATLNQAVEAREFVRAILYFAGRAAYRQR